MTKMNEYVMSMERRNLREVAYGHNFIHIQIIILYSYEHNVQSLIVFMHRLGDASPPPTAGGRPAAQHASPDEAHRTINPSSGRL